VPTYQYACTECGHRFEAVQAFSDDALTACPECGGALRKVYGSVGVVFKGSGFYRTDSRSGSKSAATAAAKSSESGSSSGGGESSSGGGESSGGASSTPKPASTTSTASTSSTTAKAAAS
jgi:putative FmdB family regulatory protein